MVLYFDAEQFVKNDYWTYLKETLPDTVSKWTPLGLASWLEKTEVLFLVDDLVMQTDHEVELKKLMEEFAKCSLVVVTTPEDVLNSTLMLGQTRPVLPLRMKGLRFDQSVSLCATLLGLKDKDKPVLRMCLDTMEFRELLRFPSSAPVVCYLWTVNRKCFNKKNTLTELLWTFSISHFDESVPVSTVEKFLRIAGQLAYEALRGRVYFSGDDVYNLLAMAKEMFPEHDFLSFIGGIFHDYLCLPPECGKHYCIRSLAQQQMLVGWHVLYTTATGTPIKRILKKVEDEDSVAFYVAGHFARQTMVFNEFDSKVFERIVRNLAIQSERSEHPIGYTLRIIHEFQCQSKLVDCLLKDTVYPYQLDVHDKAIISDALKTYMEYAMPKKVIMTVNRDCTAPDILPSLQVVSEYGVNLSLAMMNHLRWESLESTIEIAEVLEKFSRLHMHDLIGYLDVKTIHSLHEYQSMKNLVCIRIRVTEKAAATELFRTPKHLPSLMWLEADFDMPFEEVLKCDIPPTSTPLMDLIFKDIKDSDVKSLCRFMSGIRKRYSGLHILRSYLSPQGVTNILKEFYIKDVLLNTDPVVINRYRRWRFPELAVVEKGSLISDETACHLLGYDDRKHYNDNEIRSCHCTTRSDLGAFKNFLLAIESLKYIEYSCANYNVIKNFEGEITVQEGPTSSSSNPWTNKWG